MKISTKGRYALRLMTDLANSGQEGYVSLKDVAAGRIFLRSIWSRSPAPWPRRAFFKAAGALRADTGWPRPLLITQWARSYA